MFGAENHITDAVSRSSRRRLSKTCTTKRPLGEATRARHFRSSAPSRTDWPRVQLSTPLKLAGFVLVDSSSHFSTLPLAALPLSVAPAAPELCTASCIVFLPSPTSTSAPSACPQNTFLHVHTEWVAALQHKTVARVFTTEHRAPHAFLSRAAGDDTCSGRQPAKRAPHYAADEQAAQLHRLRASPASDEYDQRRHGVRQPSRTPHQLHVFCPFHRSLAETRNSFLQNPRTGLYLVLRALKFLFF